MNVYIVSGANGFLGNNIVRLLQNQNDCEIRCIVVPKHNIDPLKGLKCKIFYASVENSNSLDEVFKVDKNDDVFVIHCAAKVSVDDKTSDSLFDINVNGTKNMLEHAYKINAKFIYVSSSSVYFHKSNKEIIDENSLIDINKTKSPYEKSKIQAMELVKSYYEKGSNCIIVCPSSIFGPNDYKNMFVEMVIIQLAKGKLNLSVNGSYDFVDVRDVSEAIIKLCEKGKSGETYIISNEEINITTLMNIVNKILDRKEIKISFPNNLVLYFLPLYKLFSKNKELSSMFSKESLKVLKYGAHLDNSKLKRTISYNPRNIDDSLSETIAFLKNRHLI